MTLTGLTESLRLFVLSQILEPLLDGKTTSGVPGVVLPMGHCFSYPLLPPPTSLLLCSDVLGMHFLFSIYYTTHIGRVNRNERMHCSFRPFCRVPLSDRGILLLP